MLRPSLALTVLMVFGSGGAFADTIEFIRGGTVNGSVTLQDGKFTLEATFGQGGKRKIVIERKFVANLVINSDRSNPGAAPANFGVFTVADEERFEMNTVDMLRLKDGERLRGRVQSITANSIIFSGEEIPRADVKDLLMGSAVVR